MSKRTEAKEKSNKKNGKATYNEIPDKYKRCISVYDIARIGLIVAVIEVSKAALAFLPNIELTTFWLIMFSLLFDWQIVLVVPVFILIEGCIYGFGLWWLMYLYTWPLLVLFVKIFRKQESAWFWAVFSGAFGLSFGALCSVPYFFIGLSGGGFVSGLQSAFAWWIAGIPWDIVHCIGNFILMLILYHPMRCIIIRFPALNY